MTRGVRGSGVKLAHGVKFIEGEFYLRCSWCHGAHRACYWPLTLEFWEPGKGLSRCRACWRTDRRLRDREGKRMERDRRYYAEARDYILAEKRRYYQEHRDEILAKRRLRHRERRMVTEQVAA